MRLRSSLLVFVFTLCSTLFAVHQTAMAWGSNGHRIVAEIAERHLTKKAKKNIQKIIGPTSLAMIANWPDFIKSDPRFDSLDKSHYVNLPQGLSYEAFIQSVHNNKDQNVYNAILLLKDELKQKNLDDSLKVMYVKLLVHFVGDLHQPMHTGRPEDLGGNRVRLEWFNEKINLHQLWDDRLIDYQKLSYTEYVNWINHATKAQKKMWQSQSVADWLYDSYLISNRIYAETPEGAKLKYKYNFDFIDDLNLQLLKGGIRLAAILNEIFG